MGNATAAIASALPVLPPVPAGPEPFFRARGLAALIAALDDAVISCRGPNCDAIVVVVGGRVLDAISVPAGRPPLVGLEALNALSPADSPGLHAAAVDRRLALTLPSYWREPDRLPPIPGRWVDPAGLVEAIVRRGSRGVVIVRSPLDTGLVLFDETGLIAAYSEARAQPGGLETLSGLLGDIATVIHARVSDASGETAHAGATDNGAVAALPDPIERCRSEIVDMTAGVLHLHGEAATARFRAAPATTAGLLLAAEEVRGLRPRLISPMTMNAVAGRAEEIVRAVSRRS